MMKNFIYLLLLFAFLPMAKAEVLVLSPAVEGQSCESYIMGYGAKNTNYGNAVVLYAGHNDGLFASEVFGKRSFIKFDLSSVTVGAEQFVKVNSAKLYLWQLDITIWGLVQYDGPRQLSAHTVTKPWNELEVTMMNATSATTWDNPGGDYEDYPVAFMDYNPMHSGWNFFGGEGLAAEVQEWIMNSSTNYGLLLRETGDLIKDWGGGPGIHCPPGRGAKINLSYWPYGDVEFPTDVSEALGFYMGPPIPILLVDYTIHNKDCQGIIDAGYGPDNDLSGNCYVDFADIALLAMDWLSCNDPIDSNCVSPW